MTLKIRLSEFPPSINKLYVSLPRFGKAMSQEGKRFKRVVLAQMQEEWGPDLVKVDPNTAYEVEIYVYFPLIINKGWPETAQQKYKKRDADNLLKLLLDTLADAMGIDDANFLRITVEKLENRDNPHIYVKVSKLG